MEEPVFITYANSNLTENPEVFYQLFEYFKNINEQHPTTGLPRIFYQTEVIIKYFVRFAKADGIESAREILKKESQEHLLATCKEGYEKGQLRKLSEEEVDEMREDWVIASLEISPEVRLAFEAVFGYRDDFCENGSCFESRDELGKGGPCPKFIERIFAFDRELLRGENRLKCYECHQMMFKKILEGVTKGIPYSAIPERFITNEYCVASFTPEIGHQDNDTIVEPGKKKDGKMVYWVTFRERLIGLLSNAPKSTMIRLFHFPLGQKESIQEFRRVIMPAQLYDRYHKRVDRVRKGDENPRVLALFFCELFNNTILAYNLAEFLVKNGSERIKQCPYCEKFYIAKDIKRQRCYSKKCQREYERQRKQKQREDDPVKYY